MTDQDYAFLVCFMFDELMLQNFMMEFHKNAGMRMKEKFRVGIELKWGGIENDGISQRS